MAINLEYQPSAQSLGAVAYQAGAGQYRQRQQERQDQNERTMLQAALQERSRLQQAMLAQQGMAFDQQRQLAGQNFQQAMQGQEFQFRAQQQQFANSFEGLPFDQRSMILKSNPGAMQEWQAIQGEYGKLDEAMAQGKIRPEHYQGIRQKIDQRKMAFDPTRYMQQWEPGKGPGEIWQQEVDIGGQKVSVPYTRDRNNMPVPTFEGQAAIDNHYKLQEIGAQNSVKQEVENAKIQATQELNAAKAAANWELSSAQAAAKQEMDWAKFQNELQMKQAQQGVITPEVKIKAYETAVKMFTTSDPVKGDSVDMGKVEEFVQKILGGETGQPQQPQASGGALFGGPQTPQQPSMKPPPISLSNTPESKALYDSWPSGTLFYDPQGVLRRKP